MSYVPAAPSFSSAAIVSPAGASRRSILCATPACCQCLRPTAVHSALTSQATIRPSSGSASAMASEPEPVKVPTSITRLASVSLISSCSRASASGRLIMPEPGSLRVSARRACCAGVSRDIRSSMKRVTISAELRRCAIATPLCVGPSPIRHGPIVDCADDMGLPTRRSIRVPGMRFGALARTMSPLTYADPTAPVLERTVINLIEMMGGRTTLVKLYEHWRAQWPLSGMSLWSSALYWLGVSLQMGGEAWPPQVRRDERLVVIANHPYGLLDGIAICALAEKLGRPFKILAHSQLMRVPELIPYFLPIDFNETEDAVRNNIEARRRALDALHAGETIVIFPAGGVSTAPLKLPLKQFGRANDLPWKNFAYRLIRSAEATVLPLYFVGQNGPMFHAASRVSMAWRIALLVGELNKRRGTPLQVRVGHPIAWSEMAAIPSAALAMHELRRRVYALGLNQ